MVLPLVPIIISGVTNYFIKKIAKAKSQEIIDKVLDTILEYLGPWLISALKRAAAKTNTTLDDTGVKILEDILNLKGDK